MNRRLLFLAALGLLYLLSIKAYYVGFFNDDAFYIIGARSLLHGRYVELNAPGRPPLVNYPPGYPLLLAPLALISGGSFWAYQLLSAALTLGSVGLLWAVFEGELDSRALWAAAAVSALNPLMVALAGVVLSEVPYLFLTLLFFAAARRWWHSESLSRWAVLGALAGFCFLVRTSGAAVPAALFACLLLERRGRAALVSGFSAALAAAPYLARNFFLTGHSELRFFEWAEPYLGRGALSALALSAGRNAFYYTHELFWRVLFRWPAFAGAPVLETATAGLGLAALAWGARLWGGRGWRKLPIFYLGFYAAAHLPWAMQTGRYLYPAVPLCLAFLFSGVAACDDRLGLEGKGILGVAALSVGLSLTPLVHIVEASVAGKTPPSRPPERTSSWIRAHTGPADVFAAELDGRLHLLTGRPVVHALRIAEPGRFAQWLGKEGVRYVLVSPTADITRTPSGRLSNDAMPADELARLLSDPGRYELVFDDRAEGSSVYRVKP